MRGLIALAAALIAFVPAHGFAEEPKNATINIQIPEEISAGEKLYAEAFAKLKPEKKAILEKMDKDYTATLEPDMQIYSHAMDLQSCQDINQASPELNTKFLKFRDHQNKLQEQMWHEFDNINIAPIDFIEHGLVKKHLVGQRFMQLYMAMEMVKLAYANADRKEFPKRCADFKTFLDDYLAKNAL